MYEILEGETLGDIIDFALGFNQKANKSNIAVSYLDLNEAAIITENVTSLSKSLKNALSINVFNYVSENTSNILVSGALQQPGFYDIKKHKTLEDLIANLQFVNVYPWLGVLEQFDETKLVKSTVLFNLNDPKTYKSIKLLPNSSVFFANLDERTYEVSEMALNNIKDYELVINHKQNTYRLPIIGEYSVKSFIDFLGLDMNDVDEVATYVSPLEDIVVNDSYKNMNFTAKKYNTVSFKSPDKNLIKVTIAGSVEYPGVYTLSNDSTIEDLYNLVGKFKNQAYLEGIVITRETIRKRQIESLERAKSDLNKAILVASQKGDNNSDLKLYTSLAENINFQNLGRLAGNFAPNSDASKKTILSDGDEIIVPNKPNYISVLGEVLNPISFEYSNEMSILKAINQAGGYQQSADKRRVYVISASGLVKKANRNIFAKNVQLYPGDTIVVPLKAFNNPGLNALLPYTKVLSDLAFSAAALDNLTSN